VLADVPGALSQISVQTRTPQRSRRAQHQARNCVVTVLTDRTPVDEAQPDLLV
jgi:hypothetical protein